MSFFSQILVAIAILAAFFALVLWRRGQTLAARRALQRALLIMAGSALLALVIEVYGRGRTP